MKKTLFFVAGLAVGYVLGARAGRERYEQLRNTAQRFSERPAVQEAAGIVQAKADELVGAAKHKMGFNGQAKSGLPKVPATPPSSAIQP